MNMEDFPPLSGSSREESPNTFHTTGLSSPKSPDAPLKKAVGAIFIHAGAGVHSERNEPHHLAMLSKACIAAMDCIKAGQHATRAVQAAIKVMEDTEFTNAGIGSNLSERGIVEGDANIVDERGLSGACGAVPGVKNPISLALEVLENYKNPEDESRLPPNLLVGQGARSFAERKGVPTCSDCDLITYGAKSRWNSWLQEFKNQVEKTGQQDTSAYAAQQGARDHTNAILTGPWNEGQPDSPTRENFHDDTKSIPFIRVTCSAISQRSFSAPITAQKTTMEHVHPSCVTLSMPKKRIIRNDVAMEGQGLSEEIRVPSPLAQEKLMPAAVKANFGGTSGLGRPPVPSEDGVQDTVGAIAIDLEGRIAAGSSSGGVGMKLHGRIGPAALVGVGTAVLPMSLDADGEPVAVATVLSGTGEHFATTQAAQSFSTTVQDPTANIKAKPGQYVTEEMAMENFIRYKFLAHPSIRISKIPVSIGILSVKQTKKGYYVHWGHNTQSFAVASFSTEDKRPKGVISRMNIGLSGKPKYITTGARKVSASATRKGWSWLFSEEGWEASQSCSGSSGSSTSAGSGMSYLTRKKHRSVFDPDITENGKGRGQRR